jgi:hypothetical protein
MLMLPKYPIYIVSKGRWETRLTADALEGMGQPYWMVVEQHEFDNYATKVDSNRLLVLPKSYLDGYKTCDDDGDSKSKGPGAARNFCLDHSKANGHLSHWVMDDNIDGFYRLNRNLKVKCLTPAIFRAAEDFVDRYENVPLAGLNYAMFAKRKDSAPPFVLNTRIYSCLLIRNDIKHRWDGRYNEDTHLSLRVLKDGDCTIQFNAFLANKVRTQTLAGGNTDAFYAHEGTLNKSKMLQDLHPDVSTVVWKFDRWHHFVDYNPFKKNMLKKKPGLVVVNKNNEYGMKLCQINNLRSADGNP